MIRSIKENLWKQFGASIDMLYNAISMCPEEEWNAKTGFWYIAYHTLFFLDYYLTTDAGSFLPPAPFTLSEFEDRMPEKVYTKDELIVYLTFCRSKCQQLIASLNEEKIEDMWMNVSQTMHYSWFELLLYNMRHVQHHTAQLNLLLRQQIDDAPQWLQRAKEDLT